MATEQYQVRNRFTGEVAFTATIECEPSLLPRFKLGLAVRWAYRSGADLRGAVLRDADLRDAVLSDADLSGADLSGADLRDADLSDAVLSDAVLRGADLRGADLRDAVLSGAVLRDEKINRILASVSRVNGGYTFNLFDMQVGPPKVVAGCRFLTITDYRAHIAREYPDTAKASETLRILDFFDATVAAEVVAVAATEAA